MVRCWGAQYSNVSNTVVQAVGDGWKVHQIMVDKVRGVISDLLVTPEGIVWVTTNEGITKLRGTWHQYNSIGLSNPILTRAIFHPDFLLRYTQFKKQTWEDLQEIQKKLS